MRKTLVLIFVLYTGFLLSIQRINLTVGLNQSNIYGKNVENVYNPVSSIGGGIGLTHSMNKMFDVQTELLWLRKGTIVTSHGYRVLERYDYLEIPVMVSTGIGKKNFVSIYGGPDIGLLINGKNFYTTYGFHEQTNVYKDLNPLMFNLIAGFNISLSEKIKADFRYSVSLNDTCKKRDEFIDHYHAKNKNFLFSLRLLIFDQDIKNPLKKGIKENL